MISLLTFFWSYFLIDKELINKPSTEKLKVVMRKGKLGKFDIRFRIFYSGDFKVCFR